MNAPTVKEKAPLLDLNSMAEENLDAIPDAPDFSNPPAGEYIIEVKEAKIDFYAPKGTTEKTAQRLKITYSVLQTIALANKDEAPVPDGTMFSETFQGTQDGLGYFKNRVKALMDVTDLNGVSLGDMLSSVKGAQIGAKIAIKKSPNPQVPGEFYENIQLKIVPKP